jgi:hypothetical protein
MIRITQSASNLAKLRVVIPCIGVSCCFCLALCADEPKEQQAKISTSAAALETDLTKIDPELADLAKQIIDYTKAIKQFKGRNGKDTPTLAQTQKSLEVATKLYALMQKRIPLRYGPRDQYQYAEYERLTEQIKAAQNELAKAQNADTKPKAELQTSDLQQIIAEAQRQLQDSNRQLDERETQLAAAAKQLAEQRRSPLPPLPNGTMKIYHLNSAPARDAAQTVESLIGSQALRLAVDERSNTLIAYTTPDSVAPLDALLNRLDEQAAEGAKGENSKQSSAAAPRSLLLRVFWLADNLPPDVGQAPEEFLPKSVLQATNKLGLVSPRLLTQTVNSLAIGREDAVEFSTYVPALLFDQPVSLTCEGKLKLASDDRVRSEMTVHVEGPGLTCNLRGSLATPLGHYMVLGTANSVLAEGAAGGPVGGGPGMMAPGGVAGTRGGIAPGQPLAGGFPSAAAPGPAAGPEGGAPGGEMGAAGAQQPGTAKFNTSRFAFVVQVVEGQSYEAEKDKSDSK